MPVEIKPKAPAPQASPAPAPSNVGADSGETITMPNVDSPAAKVDGAEPVVSDGAEFEVLHTIVGAFDGGAYRAGDRIKASDLGENINIDRLIRYEALKPLADAPARQKTAKK